MFIVAAIHWMTGFKSTDRFYTPLPLYHTAGGCMSTGQMLIYGSTLIIRKKFSASAYFADVRKYEATVSIYYSKRNLLNVSCCRSLNILGKCVGTFWQSPRKKPTNNTNCE